MESGNVLEKKARDRLNNTTFYDWFDVESKKDECVTLLKKASNKYISEKKYEEAIKCMNDCNKIYTTMSGMEYNASENLKLIDKNLLNYI